MAGQPAAHRLGRLGGVHCDLSQAAGEDRAVPADGALDTGDVLVWLALHAVLALDDVAGSVGVGVEPGDREVLVLPPPVAGRDGFVAAGWAAGRGHREALAFQLPHQLRVRLAAGSGDPGADRPADLRLRRPGRRRGC